MENSMKLHPNHCLSIDICLGVCFKHHMRICKATRSSSASPPFHTYFIFIYIASSVPALPHKFRQSADDNSSISNFPCCVGASVWSLTSYMSCVKQFSNGNVALILQLGAIHHGCKSFACGRLDQATWLVRLFRDYKGNIGQKKSKFKMGVLNAFFFHEYIDLKDKHSLKECQSSDYFMTKISTIKQNVTISVRTLWMILHRWINAQRMS